VKCRKFVAAFTLGYTVSQNNSTS